MYLYRVLHFARIMTKKQRKGSPRFLEIRNEDTTKANAAREQRADDWGMSILLALNQATLENPGMTQSGYARWLNERGYKTRRGSVIHRYHVLRVFRRFSTVRGRKAAASWWEAQKLEGEE